MKNGKINPLDVKNLRKVTFPAEHFTYITIPKYSGAFENRVSEWIRSNLSGRYYVGRGIMLDRDNVTVFVTRIGFENHREESFFNLMFTEL